MREEEIDKILKSTINNDIKAPETLRERISNEIKNIDNVNNNNKTRKKGKKSILKVMQSIAAIAVISILGVTTYATVTKNPILEKLGIIKGSTTYKEVAKEINQDLSNDYAKITLKRMASDNAYIIMEYNVILNEEIPKFGELKLDFLGNDISIGNSIKINNEETYKMEYVNKISDREYDVFQIIQITNIESKNLKIEILEEYLYLIADKNYIEINKEVLIDATKNENAKIFKSIEKKIENKTITIDTFQNTPFETFIKVSVDISDIRKEDLELFYSERNPNNMYFTVLDKNNNYIPNICYMEKSFIEDEFGNNIDILGGYDGNNVSFKNTEAHLEYIITLGDIDKEIKELKLIPYMCILPNERSENYDNYYDNLEWHKLQSGEYKKKNTFGGEIEITKMEADSEKIKFSYDLRGFITGREQKVLLRINDEELGFNVVEPTNTYTKRINSEENSSEFYRNIENTGIYSYNFKNEDDYKLNDISKIEFALLAEPTIKLLDGEIELTVLEESGSYLKINEVQVKKLDSNRNSNTNNQNVINDIVDLQDKDDMINNEEENFEEMLVNYVIDSIKTYTQKGYILKDTTGDVSAIKLSIQEFEKNRENYKKEIEKMLSDTSIFSTKFTREGKECCIYKIEKILNKLNLGTQMGAGIGCYDSKGNKIYKYGKTEIEEYSPNNLNVIKYFGYESNQLIDSILDEIEKYAKNNYILKDTTGDVTASKLTLLEAQNNRQSYKKIINENINEIDIFQEIYFENNRLNIKCHFEEILNKLGLGTHMGAGVNVDEEGIQIFTIK